MAAYLQELENLPEILERMEDLNAAHLPQATPHRAIDRASIKIDYKFALRHYIDGAASTFSGINTPSTPSFQISALETSSSLLTSEYHTAPMSQISNGECCQPSRKCTQILVCNVGVLQTMAFQVAPEDTIGTIKSLIRERIGLEHASFELLYSSRVLNSDKSIDEYGIPHDATLTCLSFRPNRVLTSSDNLIDEHGIAHDATLTHLFFRPNNAPFKKPLSLVIIKTIMGITFRLSVKADTLVHEVKLKCVNWRRIGRLTDIRLIHAGKQLGDHHRLSDCGIGDEDKLYLVPKLGAPLAASHDKIPGSQEEDEARPPDSEPKKIGNQVLSFWKTPFRTTWVPRRRVYGGIKT